MNYITWQIDKFVTGKSRIALIWKDQEFTYGDLLELFRKWRDVLSSSAVIPGSSVGIIGDFSLSSISCILALIRRKCILVPLSSQSRDQHQNFKSIAELNYVIEFDDNDNFNISFVNENYHHPLLKQLQVSELPGLILFSSGSTGKPKAILHALPELLKKFQKPRYAYRTINFLLFDHIGGINTLFYTLANLGCAVVPSHRTVSAVCKAIEKHSVELLPTTPSFLKLMLLEKAYRDYNLTPLKLITYGTEVMDENTLNLVRKAFPHARFQQTYGLSEIGILRSKSKADDSLYVQLGGEGYETKVVNGILWIRSKSSMLGYLNEQMPYDEEGWFNTGDAVIQDGDYYRILGRESDIINVGGQKVYPAEVEKILAEIPYIIDVVVKGEPHMILGQVVSATVQMRVPILESEMKKWIVEHSKGRLQPFMIPVKVRVVTESLISYRFKKVR